MQIGLAKQSELFQIRRYDGHIPLDRLEACIADKLVYVLRDQDTVAGVLRYSLFWQTLPFLDLLYVDAACRGSGYGRRLMACWEAALRAMGYKYAMLSTQEDETAKDFYAKLGYEPCGSFWPPEQGAAELMFRKAL